MFSPSPHRSEVANEQLMRGDRVEGRSLPFRPFRSVARRSVNLDRGSRPGAGDRGSVSWALPFLSGELALHGDPGSTPRVKLRRAGTERPKILIVMARLCLTKTRTTRTRDGASPSPLHLR